MPYVSTKQARFFNANRAKLQKQGVDVDEWNRSTDFSSLPERHVAKKHWMQGAADSIKAKGTSGVFSNAAAKAGKSTAAYASEHEHDEGKIGRRARLAKAFISAKH